MNMFTKNKVLVILGPTATGKTDLGIALAQKLNGEIVSGDSRQVYIGLDIGTGKMPNVGGRMVVRGRRWWEINGIRVWLYDVVNPQTQYTVADYVKDATVIIEDILKRDKLSIIVGGTGFYLKALLEGLPNLSVPVDKNLREELENLSLGELQEKLKQLSPTRWERFNESDSQNPRRLLRAIEIASMNPYAQESQKSKIKSQNWNVLKIGLTAPREVLYKKVDLRISSRLDQGMVEEAENLYKSGLSLERMRQLGLEYRILADYLDGHIKSKELKKIMEGQNHGYVRRQLTWFKKEQKVSWFDISEKNWQLRVENLVQGWYND